MALRNVYKALRIRWSSKCRVVSGIALGLFGNSINSVPNLEIAAAVQIDSAMFVSCPPPNPRGQLTKMLRHAHIIPNVLPCEPQAVIQVLYPCDIVVEPGTTISVDAAVKEPIIRWKTETHRLYTFLMIDLDMPKSMGQYLLWMVGNIPGCDVVRGETIVAYMPKRTAEGKQYHRSLFLAYQQYLELDFDEPYLTASDTVGRAHFDVNRFAMKYALGSPTAANFFVAEWDWGWEAD